VQIARHAGATVTAVCGPARAAFVAALGADSVIDYTKVDFASGGSVYDTIIDVLGKSRYAQCRRVLAPRGRLVYLSFKVPQLALMLWTALIRGRQVRCLLVNERPQDLLAIKAMVEAGALRCPVDRTFPLHEAAAAHRYAESGARQGAVVLTVIAQGAA
jgi:NADPH2:quinone reductase